MSQHSKPRRILVLAIIVLVALIPALATAQPHRGESLPAAAAHPEATPSLLTQLRSLLSILWKNGSGLEPNGRPGAKPDAATSGDNGSGLEPNG